MIRIIISGLALVMFTIFSSINISFAADHVDAPLTMEDPQIDISDVYAFLDPNDDSQIVVAMGVNPFLVPEDRSSGFGSDVLYQFKFDNDGDAVEDYVVQVLFDGEGFNQQVRVKATSVKGKTDTELGVIPVLTGPTQNVLNNNGFRVYAGLSDDAFVFDFSQFIAISKTGTQDVFRDFTSPILGQLKGRSVRPDGTSGVDFFAGVNASHIVVSFPKSIVDNGTGFFNGLAGTDVVGIWATTSRNGIQRERMGQEVVNTVFVPDGMKDDFNEASPSDDVAMFSGLIPDALTQVDNDGTGNTINGRIAVLQLSGLTELPNGAPLLLPEGFEHPLGLGNDLLRVALLPDVLRLDLNRPADDLAIGLFGLQNGRRPQDDVGDIALQLLRQLADIKFPDGAMVTARQDTIPVPGSGPIGERAALDCSNAEFPQCTDRRVLVALQGTDFNTTDNQINALDYTTSGNDREFQAGSTSPYFSETEFPFMAIAQGESGSSGSSGCSLLSKNANPVNTAMEGILPFAMVILVFGVKSFSRRIKY